MAFALLIYLATQVRHTFTEVGFAISTGGVVLTSPQIIEALAPRRARAAIASKPFRRVLLVLAAAGVGFVVVGVVEGELKTPGSAGQSDFLIGVSILTLVAIIGPVIQWLQFSTRDIVASVSDERTTWLRQKCDDIEAKGVWTSLGAVLFVAGVGLQFVAIGRG